MRDLVALGWHFDVITVGNLEAEGGTGRLDRFLHDGAVETFQISSRWWGQQMREQARTWVPRTVKESRGADKSNAINRLTFTGMRARAGEFAINASEIVRDLDWVRRAWPVANQLITQRDYRAIIVSSPRHLTQLIGAGLARRADKPYIPDFRDPWYFGRLLDRERQDWVTATVWRSAERWCMRHAHCAVDISEAAQNAVSRDLPTACRVPRYFIPSGYDRNASIASPDSDRFRILYSGTVYPFNPVPELFAACSRLVERYELTIDEIAIEFVGRIPLIDGCDPYQLAARYGLRDRFVYKPRVSAEQANTLQQRAAVLVAFDSVCLDALCIPSKLYHYAQMKGDLLLIGNPRGAMAIEAAKIDVAVHDPDEKEKLNAALAHIYERWRAGLLVTPNDTDRRFDVRLQSQRMHDLLKNLPDSDDESSVFATPFST